MDKYFKGDTYVTPPNKRKLIDKMFLNTRWYFVKKYFCTITNRKMENPPYFSNEEWSKITHNVFNYTEHCGGKFNISGIDNIRNLNEPVVYVCNHMSTLETFVLPFMLLTRGNITFVVKESLITNFLFGPTMRATNPITVKRENPRDDFKTVMEKGLGFLKQGTSVVIFPQSTRNTVFTPKEFNTLGIKLAKSAGVKILPIAVKTDFWPSGKIIKELAPIKRHIPIHIKFGEPLTIEGNGKQQHADIIDFIATNYESWGGKVSKDDQ